MKYQDILQICTDGFQVKFAFFQNSQYGIYKFESKLQSHEDYSAHIPWIQ